MMLRAADELLPDSLDETDAAAADEAPSPRHAVKKLNSK